MNITTLALLALTPILVWRIYSRLKTQMARQRSIMSRHYTGILVFGALILVPLAQVMARPMELAALAAGTALGVFWGVFALRHTRYEDTQEGYWFTPPMRLGIVMAMVLVARILYVVFELYTLGSVVGCSSPRGHECPPYKIGRSAVNTRAATVRWAPRAHAELRAHGTTFQSNTVNTANVSRASR